MTLQRAIQLARKRAFGGVCSLREGEEQEYHKMALAALEAQRDGDVTVRHGMWNDINSNARNPVAAWVCRCSLCGCPQDYKHNFCPNCGAKMDLEDKP